MVDQAGIGYRPASQAAGLADPVTMEDQNLTRMDLLSAGYTPFQVRQMMGGIEAPAAEPVSYDDPRRQGVLEDLWIGTRGDAGNRLTGIGELSEDYLGSEGFADFMKGAGEYVGPNERQQQRELAEDQWRQEMVDSGQWSEGRKFASEAGEAITEAAPSIGATFAVGAGAGALATAVVPVPGARVAGALIGGIAASAPVLYEEGLKLAESKGLSREDPEVQRRAGAAMLGGVALEQIVPMKALAKINGPAASEIVQTVAGRLGKDVAKDGLVEGMTEVGQLAIQALALDPDLHEKLTDEEKGEILPYLVEEYGKDAALSLIAGGVAGGGLGGATGARAQMVTNTAARKDAEYLAAAAKEAGVGSSEFEGAIRDPERVQDVRQAAAEIGQAERARAAALDAIEAVGGDVAPELQEAADAASARADAAHDKWIAGKFGGQTAGQMRQIAEQKDNEARTAAYAKLPEGLAPPETVDTVDLQAAADQFETANAARETAMERLRKARKPKQIQKRQQELNDAIDQEATARERLAQMRGEDPVKARDRFVGQMQAEQNTTPVNTPEYEEAVQRQMRIQYPSDMTPEARLGKAERELAREAKARPKREEKLQAEIDGLRKKAEGLTDPKDLAKVEREIDHRLAQIEGSSPAIEAARRVVQEAAGSQLSPEAPVVPEADQAVTPDPAVDNVDNQAEDTAQAPEPSAATPKPRVRIPARMVRRDAPEYPTEAEIEAPAAAQALDAAEVDMTAPLVEEQPEAYFEITDDSTTVPVDQLVATRARPDGIENAGRFMRMAAEGRMGRRPPISVRAEPDGTYTVLDGNSTFANMRESGWTNIPVRVMDDAQFAQESAPKFAEKTGTEVEVEGDTIVARGPASSRPAAEARAGKEGLKLRFEATDAFPADRQSRGVDLPNRQYRWTSSAMENVGTASTVEDVEARMRDLPDDQIIYEYGAAFDADGNLLEFGTNEHRNNIAVPAGDDVAMFTHSHPVNVIGDGTTPFSTGDISLFTLRPSLQSVRAVLLGNGQAIEMRGLPPVYDLTKDGLQGIARMAHDAAVLVMAQAPNGVSPSRAARVKQQTLLYVMEAEGYIEYTSPAKLDRTEEEMVNDAVAEYEDARDGDGLSDDVGSRAPQAGQGLVGAGGAPLPAALSKTAESPENRVSPPRVDARRALAQSTAENMSRRPSWEANERIMPQVNDRLEATIDRAVEATGVDGNIGPMKKYDSALRKATAKSRDGRPNFGRLGDLVRGMFKPTTNAEAEAVVEALSADPAFDVIDEGWRTIPSTGYMDRKLTLIDTATGMQVEVQLIEPKMAAAKKIGHSLYEQSRVLQEGDPELVRLEAEQREIYSQAVADADPSIAEVYEPLAVAQSVVELREGVEDLAPYGIEPGGSYKTRQIAEALEKRQKDKHGLIDRKDRSDEAKNAIADWIADEVKFEYEMNRTGSASAVGWYSEKYQRALDEISKVHPELARGASTEGTVFGSSKEARDYMTSLVALTSDGEKVYSNWKKAVDLYGLGRETGVIPPNSVDAPRGSSMRGNIEVLNDLWAEHKGGLAAHLLEQVRVGDVNAALRARGEQPVSGYQANTLMPRAAIYFGPKLGAFNANLLGAEGYLTMDRWWSRTFNRYRGDLVDFAKPEGVRSVGLQLQALEHGIDPVPSGLRGGTKKYRAELDRIEAELQELGVEPLAPEDAINRSEGPMQSYKDKGFKNGTSLEKAANTVYKAAFENLNDQPFNATDRTFMIEATQLAQEKLRQRNVPMSIADIQAVLWYFEKRLYAEMGARATPDVSYEEVAKRLVEELRGGSERTGSVSENVAQGPDGAGFGSPDGGPAIGDDTIAVAEALDGGGFAVGGDQAGSGPASGGQPVSEPDGVQGGLSEPADGVTYAEAMERAAQAMGPAAAQVSTVPPDAQVDRYLLDGGSTGYALDGDNIIGVFSTPDVSPAGAAGRVLADAVEKGGRRLDGFATFLPKIYARGGFKAVAKLPFDPQYAPSQAEGSLRDWDADAMEDLGRKYGQEGWGAPDVMFMVYDPDQASATTDNQVDAYEDGIAAQENDRPQYVSRNVTGGGRELLDWAREQGFEGLVSPDKLHVTTVYSRGAFDQTQIDPAPDQIEVIAEGRPTEQLGNALAIPIDSPDLQAAHQRWRDAGATHDWENYQPHVTFKYDPTPEDIARAEAAEPFTGRISLGKEIRRDISPSNQTPAVASALDEDGVQFNTTRMGGLVLRRGGNLGDGAPLSGRARDRANQRAADRGFDATVGKLLRGNALPVKTFIDYRHKFSDYDARSIAGGILDKGRNGPRYKAEVRRIRDKMLADIDRAMPVIDPRYTDRRAALQAEVEGWAERKLPRPFEPFNDRSIGRFYAIIGEYASNNVVAASDLAKFLPAEFDRKRVERMIAVGRKEYDSRRQPAVASAVDVPAYMRGPKSPKGAAETMRNAVETAAAPAKKGFWQNFETQVVNRFAPIRNMEQAVKGYIPQGFDSAFKTAEMSVNDSGRNEALLYYGAADWADASKGDADSEGRPVSGFRVREGTIGIRTMLDKLGSAQAIQDFQEFMAARRAKDLHARGIKTPLSDQDIVDGLAKETAVIKEVADDWKRFNDANIDFLVKTGRIPKKLASVLKADAAYVPFYRTDERVDGSPDLFPNLSEALKYSPGMVSQNIAGGRNPGIQKIKGGEVMKLDSIVENMIANSQAMVAAGMRNQAANMSFEMIKDAGLVKAVKAKKGKTPVAKPTDTAIKMWKDGKEKWIIPTDPAAEPVLVALAGLDPLRLEGVMKGMAQIASMFRQGITLAPSFIIRNLIRGMVATGVLTSGANLTRQNNVFTGAWDSYNRGAGKQLFTATSGMGDFRFGSEDIGFGKNDWMIEYGLAPKTFASRMRRAVNAVEEVGTATELGDRIAAMNTMVENGMRPDEAAYQALTIVNYGRTGSNRVLRQLLPLIPFLNARIQGLARLGEGALGRGNTPLTRKQAMAQMAINMSLLAVASAALWGWNNGDEEKREKYENEPLHRRLNYHIFYAGDKKILIPKAFEIGLLAGSLPEFAMEVLVQGQTEEVGEAVRQTLSNTLMFNPVPAALLPAMEVIGNYDSFTGREIEGQRFEGMAERDRYSERTPALARLLAQNKLADWTGISPVQLDHLLNGYGGAPYKFLASSLDTVAGDLGLIPDRPEGAFGSVPVASAALNNTLGSMYKNADGDPAERWLGDFYNMKDSVSNVYRSARAARLNSDPERFAKIIEQTPGGVQGVTAAYRTVNRFGAAISDLNAEIRRIQADKVMSPSAKRSALVPLVNRRNTLARSAYEAIRNLEKRAEGRFSRVY